MMKRLSFKKLGSRRSASRDAAPVDSSPVVKELTATFRVFDQDGDGKISKGELATVLRSLGDDMSDDELQQVIAKVDGDGDGFIDLDEFIRFHRTLSSSSNSPVQSVEESVALRAAFDVFDVDRNGFISAEELQTVMRSLGDKKTSLAECRHMINCVDKDGDHMVDFMEFQCLMSSTAFVC